MHWWQRLVCVFCPRRKGKEEAEPKQRPEPKPKREQKDLDK